MITSVDSSFSSVDTAHSGCFNVISQKELEVYIKAVGGNQLQAKDAEVLAKYITNLYSQYTMNASDGTSGFGEKTWGGEDGIAAYANRAVENFIATGCPFMIPQGNDGLCQVDYKLALCIDSLGDGGKSVSETELASFIQSVKPELTDDQAKTLASTVFNQFTSTTLSGGERSVSLAGFGSGKDNACKLGLLLNIIKHPEQVASSDKCTDAGIKDLLFPLINKNSDNFISKAELKDYYLERGKSPKDADDLVKLHFDK
jgi:hypothetical protein